MYNIKLAGLDTGKVYYVKVRAKVNGYETSEWTMPFRFETPMDTMPPGRIENLSWLSEGSSFIANWEAPQFNEDGSPCGDVSHYNLVFKDLDRDITRQQRTVDTSFALDFNRNVKMFGAAAGRIELTVTAVDLSDNESKTVVAIAQNPPPAKVQNVTASVGVESIGLKWDANIENDLAFYEVHVGTAAGFTPSPSTLRAKVASGSDVFTYDTSSLVTLYFKIIAVDTFNQKSVPSDVVSAQPRLTTDYDKEPPGTVSGFTVTQVLASDNTSATARISFTSNPEEDLDKYEVQHRKTGDTTAPWSFTNVPSDQTTAEIKPLPLSTSYDFRIRAVDFNANKGVWSSVVVAPGVKKTTLPAAPTGIVVTGGLTNLMVRWNASTDPSMANWGGTYEVQVSKATNFTSPITIKTASTLASFINLDANTVYYVRIRSIDPYLNTGAWSTTSNGNTGTVADPNASKITWSDTQPTGGKTNDLWIKTPENVQYRYNGTTWVKAQDSELASGIASAIASADGKNTIYYSTPPASGIKAGDTWFDGATIKVYQGGSWVDVSTALDNAKAAQALQVAGSKNKTYYVSRATATGMIEGDTLFDTTEGNKQYRYNGTTWVSVQDAAIAAADQAAGQAQQTADNKNTIYYSTPPSTGLKNGDTWFDGPTIKTYRNGVWTDSSSNLETQQGADAIQVAGSKNKTYYTTFGNRPTTGLTEGDLLFDTGNKYKQYRYTNAGWLSVQDGTIADAKTAADNAQAAANTAITNASNAFNLADGKAQVFWGGTRPTNLGADDEGDIWVDVAKTPNEIQVWSGTGWSVTGDPATKAIAEAANSLAGAKSYTYIENTAPTSASVPAPTKGDIWIKNNVTPNEVSVYTGSAWVAAGDKTARDSAATKAYIFTTTNDTAPTSPTPKRGDVWINTTTGKTKIRSTSAWVDSTDPEARTIANSKITTYYNNVAPTAPTGGFTTGDLWVRTTDNRLHRWSGAWVELKDKSITDLELLTDDIIDDLIPGLETQLDKKIEVYVQNDPPAITDAAKQKGDIWIRPDNGEVKVYSGTAWVLSADPAAKALANTAQTAANNAATAAGTAQTTADKKMQTFYGTSGPANNPVGTLKVNDLWINSDNKRLHRWNGTIWEEVKDADITAAQQAAATANQAVGNLVGTVGDLTTQVDNKVEVWFQTTQPAIPAAAADRLKMKGDIWINTSTGASNGEVKMYPGTGTVWNVVTDPAALAAAQSASTLAGTKKQVFGGLTAPLNNAGNALTVNDLWIRDTDKKMHRWTGTAWEVAQDYKIDGMALKGNNLIFNGHGELGDNTNWPSFTYTSGDAPPGSKGSFISNSKVTAYLSEYISVNPYSSYTMSVWARRLNEVQDRAYAFVAPYDAFGLTIQPATYMYYPGSTTQLTEELKPGDTSVQVQSTANWYTGTGTNFYITFWDYVDPGGKAWPKETYTRNTHVRPYDATQTLPATSIPLSAPWSGPTKPAGTWLSCGLSGGSFMYHCLANTLLQPEWTFYKSNIIGGVQEGGGVATNRFPIATASIRVGFLTNYGNIAGASQAFAGLDFSDVDAAREIATTAQASANARNRTIYTNSNANGLTRDGYAFINGDTWFRRDVNDTVIGMWEFLNGVWLSRTLNNQVISNLDAGKINAGTINADRIGANSIGAQKLVIGSGENLINDPNFTNTVLATTSNWNNATGMSVVPEGVNGSNALRIDAVAAQQATYNNPQNAIAVEAGATYRIVATVKTSAPVLLNRIRVGMRLRSAATGLYPPFSLSTYVPPQDTITEFKSIDMGMLTMPEDGTISFLIVCESTMQTGTVWIDSVSVMRATGETMIQDGAISTQKIKAEAITAGLLAADSVIAGKIATGAVTADKILAGQIDATKIVSTGLDGSVVITNGTITATQIAGQTITGDKIKANTIDAGHIQAGSITIGANSPIAPGTVATPSDVTGAISTASTDATNKANQARIDAIAAAATDAQTKADAAKLAAENAAKAYADGEISEATAQALIDAAADAQTKADAAKLAAESAAKGYTDTTVAPINTKLGQWTKTGTTFIDGGQIFTDSITAGQIAAGAITTSELATDSVTAAKIKSGEITTAKIVVGGLDGTTAIANGTITTDKLNARAVTAEKIAVGAITIGGANGHIPDGAVALPADVTAAINTAAADATAKANQAKLDAEAAAEAYANGEISAAALVAAQDAQTKANAARDAAISAASSDATTKASNAQAAAISAAATDAEAKANAAKLAAEQAAKDYADGEISESALATIQAAAADAETKANAARQAAITAAATDATTKSNQARIDAISAAATDAQTKADAAKAAAEQAAKDYADGEISEATAQALIDAAADAQTKADAAKTAAENAANVYTNTTVAPINTTLGNWRYQDTTFINGGSIYTNTITANQIAANTITADEIAANAITTSELAANSVVAGKIQSDAIEGRHLKADTALINALNIQSTLTINSAGGHIKSSNWNDAAKTGFYMDQQQLIVHNGRIEAAAIRLQDSANIIQPQFASFSSKIDAYTGLLSSGISSVVKHPGEGRFGGDALGITTNANGYLMMGKTGVPNIPIEGGQQYIISFYISSRASKVFTLQAGLYGTAAINVYATAVSIANTTAWTRYSFVVTAPANMIQAIVRFNPQNAPVTFRIDGLQVEKKVSASDLPSSWSPPGYTSIDGESITTGAISSTAPATSNPSIAAWSINTQGAARFADATIDGKLVVGSSGLDNGNISIQSDQYSAGNAGWSIKGNGDVEFNNGTFRGKLSLERAGSQEVPLRMTASVSPVKSYSTETIFSEIDTANISGVTYAYTRNDNETPGVYLPNLPDLNKRGNFFIGPTTERALNIQVHDGAEEDSIFLSNPPKNVTLTSLNIGEQTETANPPALREDQGLVFRTYRNESRDYTIGGFSTAAESNIVSNMYAAVAREKSPLIPEGYDGASEYPETKHEWMSSGVYEAPKNKNILPETAAKGKFFLRTTQNSIVSSNVQADFASQSGLGLYAHNVFRSSTGTFGFSFTVTIPTAGPQILSFYVNNTFATLPLFVGANLGGLAMIPNDPMDPTQSTPDTITKSNFTMVPAGTKSRRVSFYVSNTTAGSKSLQFVFSLGSNSSIRIAKLQLERPAYKTDASLPSDITSLHYPTPWTVNGSKVSTSTSFVLRSEPFVDPVDNALGTKMWGQVYPVVDRGIKSRSPAEAVLSFRTQYDSPVSEDRTATSADYRFAANGLTFPGRHVPYLPVGLTIDYNFMAMAQAARPVTGGSSNHSLQINDRTEWPIKLGNGRAIADNFETAVPVTETDFYVPGWGTVNQNGKSRVASNKIASYSADSYTPENDGHYYIYRVDSMDNADQSVSVAMSRYSANFNAFLAPAWGGPVINIDPSTGARIAVSYNVLEGHYKIYRFHSNGTRTELVNGSLALNNNSTPFTLTLSRQGNTLTFLANGSVVRTYTDSSLPTDGRHVGLNIRRGYFEEFRASDSAELSNTFGVLQPYSINVNTDRGIEVDSKSLIVVNAPGYYNVSCHLSPDGSFGGSASDHYQIYLQTEGDGQISTYQMSPDISQYQGGILRLQGSMVAYLSGNTRFYLWTNDTSTTRVASAQIQVVRMA